ncbi:MAG: phosphoribosylamine--glycine ligase [Bdellovibrionales bacterium]|nr:phosphoribosylamine--glycine ligase [Bdellovibrionales bacterium]
MNVLVIGKGGREHALVKALSTSKIVDTVHALPGNDGMRTLAICHSGKTTSSDVLPVVKKHDIQLVVIGPEVELVEGLADDLRKAGIAVFGPSQSGAQLEASKVFSKEFMQKYQIPTASFEIVSSVADVEASFHKFEPPYVLKVDGLAAGKGVYILKDAQELIAAAKEVFEEQKFGVSGNQALLEEFQKGWELSYLILTNGKDFQSLPLSQDHKRLKEKDQGPNTGGMGVVAPLEIDLELNQRIQDEILKPTVEGLCREGWMYRGLVYVGVMVTEQGPRVIEYNVRFGDPEAQVVLPLLDGDWGEVLWSVARGELPSLLWKPVFSACVVLAAEGYPEAPRKGVPIEGDLMFESPSSYFLHAGTCYQSDTQKWETDGGRVLNAIGMGSSRLESIENAYKQAEHATWPGRQMRKDIGQKVL